MLSRSRLPREISPPDSSPPIDLESTGVDKTFLEFSPLPRSILKVAIPTLYVFALAMIDAGLWRHDQMYVSGMGCAVVEMFIFQILLDRLPNTFRTLWTEDVIVSNTEVLDASEREIREPNCLTDAWRSERGQALIVPFMKRMERKLNSRLQWPLGAAACIVPVIWRWLTYENNGKFLTACPFDYLVDSSVFARAIGVVALLAESAIATIMGLLLWRLLAIGSTISSACCELDLAPKVRHPDGCAGFRPLGQLCLIMALVFTIPGVFLSIWVFFSKAAFVAKYHGWYTSLFEPLLVVLIISAVVSFLYPLWSVHKIMTSGSSLSKQDLDRLGKRISDLELGILQRSSMGAFDESAEMQKRADFLRNIYRDNESLPSWPCDLKTTVTFMLTQIISAATLFESLYKILSGKG